MIAAAALFKTSFDPEQRMVIHGVRWQDYVALRDTLDIPGLKMVYCEGALELMSPSVRHEIDKTMLARLIETYALVRNLRLNGYGSTTFRREAKARGAEPDECYCVNRLLGEGGFPDIVLEVIETSPLLNQLDVYRGMAIPEVWLFEDGEFDIYQLVGDDYQRAERSALLPELDFAVLARLAALPDQHDALNELRRLL